MKNVQISFDENLLNTLDNIVASSQLSRSAVVRKTLKNWIRQREIQAFENDWIRKLKDNPDEIADSEAWMNAEHWGEV